MSFENAKLFLRLNNRYYNLLTHTFDNIGSNCYEVNKFNLRNIEKVKSH